MQKSQKDLQAENAALKRRVEELEKRLKEREEKIFNHPFCSGFPWPVVLEVNGKIAGVNKAAVEFFTMESAGEMIGDPFFNYISPREKNRVSKIVESSVKNKKSTILKTLIVTKNQTMFTVEISVSVSVEKDETYIQYVIRDITAETIRRLVLEQSEESYHELFDYSTVAIYIQSLDGTFLDVNNAVLEMYGFPKEYFIGKNPMEIGAPGKNDGEELKKNFQKAINGENVRFNFWGLRNDGTIFPKIVELKKGRYFGNNVVFAFATDITDMAEAKKALSQSEKKYRLLVDNLLVGVYIIQDLKVVFCNQKFADIFGYKTPEEMYGINIKTLIPPEALPEVIRQHEKRIKGEISVSHYETKIITKKGEIRNIEVQSSIIIYRGKKSTHGIITDITSRVEAINKLRESEKRYHQLFNFLPYGGELIDNKGVVIDCSASTGKMLGYRVDEIIGKKITDFVDERAKKIFAELFPEILNGKSVNAEIDMLHKSGKRIRVLRAAQPIIEGDSGEITKIIALNIDITERIKAEEEVARLAAVVEQTVESVSITNINGTILYVNPAFLTITGYKKEEVIGNSHSILKSGKHDEAFYSKLWSTILSGKEWKGIIINKKKNGALYYERASIFPIFNQKNEIINFVKIAMDITEERRKEEMLKQSQKMEEVGALAGGIAHDFNNLLTIINGRTQLMMMREELDENLKNNLDIIYKTGQRAEKLVAQLLAYSRKQIFEPKIIAVNSIFDDLGKMLRRLIPEDITLEIITGKNLPLIKADPYQLEQILINLCVNARDAIKAKKTTDPEKRISIRTELTMVDVHMVCDYPFLSTGYHIVISVEDTGIGFDSEIKDKMFDPFFTTKEVGKGTGLGLATVYGILKQNSACIVTESEPGKGSVFSIYWPVAEGAEVSLDREETDIKELKGSGVIVVVEDDSLVRDFTVELLENAGYTVYAFENGEKAIDFINKRGIEIELMITDVIMPKMGGRELLEKISGKIPPEKVILVSGYFHDRSLTENVINTGARFIQKPFTTGRLLEEVQNALSGSGKK